MSSMRFEVSVRIEDGESVSSASHATLIESADINSCEHELAMVLAIALRQLFSGREKQVLDVLAAAVDFEVEGDATEDLLAEFCGKLKGVIRRCGGEQ